jgi:hypothetical protein
MISVVHEAQFKKFLTIPSPKPNNNKIYIALFKSGEIFARKRCQAVETDTLSVKSG